jgi:hypothetical protein
VELNAEFVPAWEHLLWTSILERDTVESARALAHLNALRIDTLARHEWDLRPIDYYDYLDHLARTGGEPSPAHADVGAEVLSGLGGAVDPEPSAFTVGNYGFHLAQLDLSRRVLGRGPPQRVAEAHRWAAALAWAGRGAWDSASATAYQYARSTGHPNGALWAFGLAATGAWLGELDPESLAGLRELAARSRLGRSVEGAAEIAWLDGIVACARGDMAVVAEQRRALVSSPAAGAPALAAALGAFEHALAGRTADAGRELAALELGNADGAWPFMHGARHPFAVGVNRLAASRWLLQTGDTAAAGSLLLLHQTDLPSTLHPMPAANIILGSYGLATLARVEARRGRSELAERYRRIAGEQADLRGAAGEAPPRCPGSPSRAGR